MWQHSMVKIWQQFSLLSKFCYRLLLLRSKNEDRVNSRVFDHISTLNEQREDFFLCYITNLVSEEYYIIIIIIIIVIIISLVPGLFFLILFLNQWWSPPLRLEASHCSTFCIMCDVPSIAVFVVNLLSVFLVQTKLRGLSPRANYTDRAAAAGRRS